MGVCGDSVTSIHATQPDGKTDSVPSNDGVLAALDGVVSSACFRKSRRMSALLRFLVESVLAGQADRLKEYVIGMEVFARQAQSYHPGDDPIVRVQMGRLRDKLQQYYASQIDQSGIQFIIPLGSYVPQIQQIKYEESRLESGKLVVLPMRSIGEPTSFAPFAQGLHAELIHHLFHAVGGMIMPWNMYGVDFVDTRELVRSAEELGVKHWLESIVRHEAAMVRVTLHLVDAKNGCLTWSGQFDQQMLGMIAAQESLARSICASLRQLIITPCQIASP